MIQNLLEKAKKEITNKYGETNNVQSVISIQSVNSAQSIIYERSK